MKKIIAIICGLMSVCTWNSLWTSSYWPSLNTYLVTSHICRTSTHHDLAVSMAGRHLFYKALRDCGHPCPEQVIVINEKKTMVEFQYSNNQQIPIIHFDEKYWNTFPIGVKRIVAFHEAMHIVKKRNVNSIEEEREADYGAISKIKCRNCTIESAQWHFNESKKRHEVEYMALSEIEKRSERSVKAILDYTRIRSCVYAKSHPLHVERGLAAYLRLREMSNAMCEYHEIEEVKKYLR